MSSNNGNFFKANQTNIRDIALSAGAKALYCYLATFRNENNCAYPSRKKIRKTMKMKDTTLSKCIQELIDCHIIWVDRHRESNRYSNNTYCFSDCVESDFILGKNEIIRNKSLSYRDIAVYALFCSFRSDDNSVLLTYEKMQRHLKISNEALIKCMSHLKEIGAVKREKGKYFLTDGIPLKN